MSNYQNVNKTGPNKSTQCVGRRMTSYKQSVEYGMRKKNKANIFSKLDLEPMGRETGLDNGTLVAGRLKIPRKWQILIEGKYLPSSWDKSLGAFHFLVSNVF